MRTPKCELARRYWSASRQSQNLRAKGLSLLRSMAPNFSVVGLLRSCRGPGKGLECIRYACHNVYGFRSLTPCRRVRCNDSVSCPSRPRAFPSSVGSKHGYLFAEPRRSTYQRCHRPRGKSLRRSGETIPHGQSADPIPWPLSPVGLEREGGQEGHGHPPLVQYAQGMCAARANAHADPDA